jgi:hypothetical protein
VTHAFHIGTYRLQHHLLGQISGTSGHFLIGLAKKSATECKNRGKLLNLDYNFAISAKIRPQSWICRYVKLLLRRLEDLQCGFKKKKSVIPSCLHGHVTIYAVAMSPTLV